MKNRNDFFNHMAERWDEQMEEDAQSLQRVVNEARIKPGQRVLDVGTGTGLLLPYISEKLQGTGMIYAVDYAEKMIKKLNAKGCPPNARPQVMDIHATSYRDDWFNIILANSCYPHFEDKELALKEIRRILKPDGFFILSHPSGRECVNMIHREAHELVERDILPNPAQISAFITSAGFEVLKTIDEEKFFLMKCRKAG